jgi:hypothetical protein
MSVRIAEILSETVQPDDYPVFVAAFTGFESGCGITDDGFLSE